MTKKAIKTVKAPAPDPVIDTTPKRTSIGFMLSEKGGMGKTTVALTAAEQMTAANHPFFLIDADASTPNVGLTYRKAMYEGFRNGTTVTENLDLQTVSRKNSTTTKKKEEVLTLQEQITFTGNADDYFLADQIFDIAKQQDVLIVMPSQVAAYLNRWIEQNDVVGMLADPDNTIDIVFFFITNGTPESLELFVESVEASQGKIPHVLVKNLGAPTNIRWERGGFDPDGKIQALLDKYGFQSIFFPEMLIAPEDKNKILSEYIPFSEAIDSNWIPFSTNRRLKKWLREASLALWSTGLIPYHPDYVPEVVLIAQAEAEAALKAAEEAEAALKMAQAAAEAVVSESDAEPETSEVKVGSPVALADAFFDDLAKPAF
jgi:hypothetical protein